MRLSTQARPILREGTMSRAQGSAHIHAQEEREIGGGASGDNDWCDLCNAIYWNYRLCYKAGTGYHWHDCGY